MSAAAHEWRCLVDAPPRSVIMVPRWSYQIFHLAHLSGRDIALSFGVPAPKRGKATRRLTTELCSIFRQHIIGYSVQNSPVIHKPNPDAVSVAVVLGIVTTILNSE